MSGAKLWLTLIGMGAITYAIRLSMILLWGRISVPPAVRAGLRFVPPAVLSAIIFPEVLRPRGALDVSFGNARLFAAAVAALVVWRTRSAVLTILAGMAVLLILQALAR